MPSYHGFYNGSYLGSQIAKFMGPIWGPPGSCRPQMGPMNLAIRGLSRIAVSVTFDPSNQIGCNRYLVTYPFFRIIKLSKHICYHNWHVPSLLSRYSSFNNISLSISLNATRSGCRCWYQFEFGCICRSPVEAKPANAIKRHLYRDFEISQYFRLISGSIPSCKKGKTNWRLRGNTCTYSFNTLRPRQNGRHFADDVLKCIFFNENVWISLKISLKFVPKGPINNIPPLV